MEEAKLEEFNHWWVSGEVDPELALQFKRDAYDELRRGLKNKFIMALTGLRRVGKTTIMYQLIQNLIDDKTDATNILFFSFDETDAKVSEIVGKYREFQKKDFREERVYIFFDEIQKCSNWENEIKKYYDLYPKVKFVVSGSESLFIRKKAKETLAGRISEYALSTLGFAEYLRLNGTGEDKFKYETKMVPLFNRFIEKGGFPETFLFETDREFGEYVKALVVDRIVYRDIPKIFKIDDPEFLRVLLELISANPGMYVDYQSLSKQFDKDRRVIKDYVIYLRESFLIRVLGNYRKGGITTLRKKKRAYPTDNALTYLYRLNRDGAFFGSMVETAVVNELKASAFWKNGGEIDIVQDGIPIEVKYREAIVLDDFKHLREFMKKFGVRRGTVITKKDERSAVFDEGEVRLIPAWKFLLQDRAR